MVLQFDHEADRTAMQTVPTWSKEPYGVLASRSPHRPNPINLCVVKLVRREKNRLFVIGLDAIDGSSLIDIKPYVKELDEAEA